MPKWHRGSVDAKPQTTGLLQQMFGDAAQHIPPTTSTTPIGPITRSRAKAIHDKVNSLLSLYTFDVSVNGSLPHGDTFCILSYEPSMEHQEGTKEDQEDGHDDALEDQVDDQEEDGGKEEERRSQEGRPRARPSLPGRPACARKAGPEPGLDPKAGHPASGPGASGGGPA